MRRLVPYASPAPHSASEKGGPPASPWLRLHSRALILILTGFLSSAIAVGYLAQLHPNIDLLSHLLIGFAPLIGLIVLYIIDALLLSLLVCSLERIFPSDDEDDFPERTKRKKWHGPRSFVFCPLTTLYLSLKEHSPPALQSTPASALHHYPPTKGMEAAMRHLPVFLVRGIPCIICMGLLFVACQHEAVNPVTPTADKGVITPLQKITQRPISDFLSTQTFASFWVSPDNSDLYYGVDYAGALDRDLGLGLKTTFEGSITERPLSDGTAEVLVDIRSHNVATWMFFASKNERVFGMDPWSVQRGATPTLGDIHFKCTLRIQSPGAALLDINGVDGLAPFTRISVEASAFGPLEAAAGLGPDGAPGHAWTNQVGLLTKTHGKPGIDGFSAEVVKLQPVGH